MYIGITQRRIGSVKEAGKIKMSVGIIAYYNLMQVCQVNVLFSSLGSVFWYAMMMKVEWNE